MPWPIVPNRQRPLALAIAIVALLGFADATWLTVEHYRGGIIPCAVTTGCQTVTTSRYAVVGSVPIALLGAVYYLAVAITGVMIVDSGRRRFVRLAVALTAIGFAVSLYLLSLQMFILRAYCSFCLLSAAIATTLFVLSLITLKQSRRQPLPPQPSSP